MRFQILETAVSFGMVVGGLGPHASRTLMLEELRCLLAGCPAESKEMDYQAAVINENILLKQTMATRMASFRHLRALYGLDPGLAVFRALRLLWDQDVSSQPHLALFCALSRDAALRSTITPVLNTPVGEPVTVQMLADAAGETLSDRVSPSTLIKIGRNTASTWAQANYLDGRSPKVRKSIQARPITVGYALYLGYLCGERGNGLFQTPWVSLLDASAHLLPELTIEAGRQGWLEYRHTGDVTDISFYYFDRQAVKIVVGG